MLNEYKEKRNELNADLKKARKKNFKNKFLAVSDGASKVWSAIKILRGAPNSQIFVHLYSMVLNRVRLTC